MQNAECRMQNAEGRRQKVLHFAFCLLPSRAMRGIAVADGGADFSKGELRALVNDAADYLLFVHSRRSWRRYAACRRSRKSSAPADRAIAKAARCASSICGRGCSNIVAAT